MALPTSKNELIDYCKRQLGDPVINIEITDDQASDAVDYALAKFVPKHYDGSEEMFLLHVMSKEDVANGYISLPNNITAVLGILSQGESASAEYFDSQSYYTMWNYVYSGVYGGIYGGYGYGGYADLSNYYITKQHLQMSQFLLGKTDTFIYNSITKRLTLTQQQSYSSSSNLFGTKKLVDDKWLKLNATVTDKTVAQVNGDLDASEVTSASAGVFGVSKSVETSKYNRGTFTTELLLQAGTYTGSVNVIMEDRDANLVASKVVVLTPQWQNVLLSGVFADGNVNDCNIRYETVTAAAGAGETFNLWSPSLYTNNVIAIQGYRGINTEEWENLWSTEWLLKYTVQVMKRQWGSNTKKFQGVQLPGGVEMNGQVIFDEAVAELEKLDEQFELEYMLPIDMMIG